MTDLVSHADAVVIGAGILGTSTAFHLARSGAKVALVERRHIAAGATGKSHSLVRMHYTNPHDAALAQLSLPYFQHWGDHVGTGDPGFVQTGVFRFSSAREAHKVRGNVEMLQGIGVNTWVVGPDEIAALDPGLRVDDLDCAAWEPDSGYADPVMTAYGFARATVLHGGTVHEGVTATRIVRDGDRITGVETDAGTISTDKVVVANGPWSVPLLAPLGFDVPLVTKRVQIVVFRRPDTERGPQTTLIDGCSGIVVRPDGEMDTLVATGFDPDPVDPNTFDEGIEPGYIADCRRRIVHRRPAMAGAPTRGGWSGAAPETPDGHIVLDELPSAPGVFVAVGCSGTNFKTGPGIGKCLAEWVTTGASRSVNLHAFRASRFVENDPVTGPFEYGEGAADVWR